MYGLLFVAIVLFIIADYTEWEHRQKETEDEYYKGLWRIKYGHYEYR